MLKGALRPLVERKLVLYLTPEERRGAVLTHGFHEPRELERLRADAHARPDSLGEEGGGGGADPAALARLEQQVGQLESDLHESRGEVAVLRGQVEELTRGLAALRTEVANLKQALGA